MHQKYSSLEKSKFSFARIFTLSVYFKQNQSKSNHMLQLWIFFFKDTIAE